MKRGYVLTRQKKRTIHQKRLKTTSNPTKVKLNKKCDNGA
jgi:hypothetical protein